MSQFCNKQCPAYPAMTTMVPNSDSIVNALIIDDDEITCTLINDMLLSNNGSIKTVAFTNPIRGMAWLSENSPNVLLAIIEYRLPMLDGLDCIHIMRKINPNLKCILCSGVGNLPGQCYNTKECVRKHKQ